MQPPRPAERQLLLPHLHLFLQMTDAAHNVLYPQSVDPNAKLSDPKHHTVQRLAEFLAALSSQAPDPRAPAKELVKPQKLLKRLLPWLQKCRQVRCRCRSLGGHTFGGCCRRSGWLWLCDVPDWLMKAAAAAWL
jgi:hypothetical protein